MGIKGVPFRYLEFSRAIRGKLRPRVRAPLPAPGARARVSYPVRFFLNRVSRVWLQQIAPAPLSRPVQRLTGNRRKPLQWLCGFCLERSVATVQTEPLQPFERICPSRSAIN